MRTCVGPSRALMGLIVLIVLMAGTTRAVAEDDSLPTLRNLLQLRQDLSAEIKGLNERVAQTQVKNEKLELQQQLDALEKDLRTTSRNFENIVAGSDLSALRNGEEEAFDFQKELFALIRPAMEEMKAMTIHVRKKAELRETVANYAEQVPLIDKALTNIATLQTGIKDPDLIAALAEVESDWKKQQALMQGELQSAQLQLERMMAEEVSLTEASQSYFKVFFRKRGLYLIEALGVMLGVLLLSRFNHYLLRRFVPGFNRLHRSFRVRLVELIHYLGTLILLILGPMLVFYLEEDWVLFSLGILLLLGLLLTLRQTLPRYIRQIELFLNIGTVREGERIQLDGLPWKVNKVNIYCILLNPDAGLKQRLHIDMLVGLKSRPCIDDEPWFPCRCDDWVVLADGVRGQVQRITEELVVLAERGGAMLTYTTADFLAANPRNLSGGFRLKEIFGISYDQQADSTAMIPEKLAAYTRERLDQEGYLPYLVDFKVEFNAAGASSLDLAMLADFNGEMAPLYGKLSRLLQRAAVDACSRYNWEIPFPQMTVHGVPSLPLNAVSTENCS
jgi:hypothetical protein